MLIILDFSEHHAELGDNKIPEKLNIQNLSAEIRQLQWQCLEEEKKKQPILYVNGEHSSSWS